MANELGPPPIASTENSPSKAEGSAAWIRKGTVANVDLKNWTIDVVGEYEGDFFEKVQVMHPYFHTNQGEGIFAMPEVGSCVLICQPSDQDTAFVLGFIGSFELEGAKQDNLEDKAGKADTETEELEKTLKKLKSPQSTTSSASSAQNTSSASARAGRPFLHPGDIMLQTRDRNFIVLRRGGVLQIGATPTCQSIYIPVKNYLRQFCENYEMSTPGGELLWNVERKAKDPGGKANVSYRLTLRDKAQNDKADIQIKMGHVSDSDRYELVVAPESITTKDGSVSGSPKFKMTIDKDGNQKFKIEGNLEYEITKNRSVKVTGTDSVEVTGARTLKALSVLEDIKTTHSLKATASSEIIAGAKTIKAATVNIGIAPGFSVVLGELLVAWLASHVHLPLWFIPDPKVGQLKDILSQTVKVSK